MWMSVLFCVQPEGPQQREHMSFVCDTVVIECIVQVGQQPGWLHTPPVSSPWARVFSAFMRALPFAHEPAGEVAKVLRTEWTRSDLHTLIFFPFMGLFGFFLGGGVCVTVLFCTFRARARPLVQVKFFVIKLHPKERSTQS